MSIRFQLLIIALTTLVLPWAGCQYARELETTLRVSQENSLQAAAATIANALSAQPQRVFRDVEDREAFNANQGDLYAFSLHNQPLLDGYREDWDLAVGPKALPTAGTLGARLQAGFTERYLFIYLEVDDPTFNPEPSDVHPEQDRFDRVNLTLQRPEGALESYFFATGAPGLIEAQSVVKSDDGIDHAALEPRIQAFWLQMSRGYHLEVRIPRSLMGPRLWVEAIDGAGGGKAGFMGAETLRGGRVFLTTPGLNELLATFIGPGTRATVIDTNGLKLGLAGSLTLNKEDDQREAGGTWYRRFVAGDTSHWPLQVSAPDHIEGQSVAGALAGHRSAEWLRADPSQASLLSAAAPLLVGGQTLGAVVLEQAGDQLLELRDRALIHLFNLTLLATALAVAIAFGVATWISVRIGRLRLAADTAVTNDGRIRLDMPESDRADEIGALSRGFERLLARLNEHTQYLRTLGGKLSHELRTPLTIVRSSLDNLESEGVRADQRGYVTRAREGVLRLQSILSALGAASRVEESIKQAERVNFDLNDLLQSAVAGYRDGFRAARIEIDAPPDACFMHGAPDLIVQMLDKLVENAVDFCTASGTITVRLTRALSNYELAVSNDGPPIPPGMLNRLFESLFEHRQGVDDKPHFGLGLYIVRLIAEFHGGAVLAANRSDGDGAIFTAILPLI
ncbi:MAG TPA: ATP-binding protein [Steroidobacteraceae bacterium]|nr:ATP-binding protein [Steroidobacteraceae bacterium]